MSRKADFFTYLAVNPSDDWGIELTTVGYHHAAPHAKYPPSGHPKTHAFEWRKGRTLDEYHLIYVPTGAGAFETRRKKTEILAGDLILLHPKDWHRYRPQDDKGWETYWVGFKGPYIEKYVRERLFTHGESSLERIGYRPELIASFDQLIELAKKETPLFKTVALGCLLQIVAYAATPVATQKQARSDLTVADAAVAFIRQNLFSEVDFRRLATSFNLSYSRFRSLFKASLGVAPHQFLLNERIACARRLLRNPGMDVKTIGYRLGFQSPSYFSKLFRRKTGVTPSTERARRD